MAISRLQAPIAENIREADTATIDLLQEQAAQSADRIADFRTRFRDNLQLAVEEGDIHHETLADERMDVVETVTRGQDDIQLEAMGDDSILGQNTIGGGRGGIRLNTEMMSDIDASSEKTHLTQVVEHEEAHGDQVRLQGEFVIGNQTIDHEMLYEGHAEIRGNEGAGMSITEHRDGQPEELYAEGQELALRIISKVGRETYEKVMTQTGDLSRLAA